MHRYEDLFLQTAPTIKKGTVSVSAPDKNLLTTACRPWLASFCRLRLTQEARQRPERIRMLTPHQRCCSRRRISVRRPQRQNDGSRHARVMPTRRRSPGDSGPRENWHECLKSILSPFLRQPQPPRRCATTLATCPDGDTGTGDHGTSTSIPGWRSRIAAASAPFADSSPCTRRTCRGNRRMRPMKCSRSF